MASQLLPQRQSHTEQAITGENMRLQSPARLRWRVFHFSSAARTVTAKSDGERYNWLDALFLLMVAVAVVGLVYELVR
jgi:hypothetical protein